MACLHGVDQPAASAVCASWVPAIYYGCAALTRMLRTQRAGCAQLMVNSQVWASVCAGVCVSPCSVWRRVECVGCAYIGSSVRLRLMTGAATDPYQQGLYAMRTNGARCSWH